MSANITHAELYDDLAQWRYTIDPEFRDRVLIAVAGVERAYPPGIAVKALCLAVHLAETMLCDAGFRERATAYLDSTGRAVAPV